MKFKKQWMAYFGCFLLSINLHASAYFEHHSQGVTYGVVEALPSKISLHWQDENDRPFRYLSALKRHLNRALKKEEKKHQKIKMLMNAGIYAVDETPAGLWIEQSKTLSALNTRQGKGNFHMQPNGVFSIEKGRAFIRTTLQYQNIKKQAEWAVQSGPMLVINGSINPRFKKEATSFYKRNAVCIKKNQRILFIMSLKNEPNLHQFAQALLELGCQQALYLDGSISAWYVAGQHDDFHWRPFVGMIAVWE